MPLDISRHYVQALDAADPLVHFRDRLHVPEGQLYLDGNSLGLLSVNAERHVLQALAAWKAHGVLGWIAA